MGKQKNTDWEKYQKRLKKEKRFLLNKVKKWCKRFKGIHIKYAYEESTNYHIVEITPASIFDDESFRKEVLHTWTKFSHNFQMSDLLISEPDESYNMTNCFFDNERLKKDKACD